MIEELDKLMAQFGDLGPASLAFLILLGVNLLLRRTPQVPNWAIPWISVAAGMILFPIFLPLTTKFQNPLGRNIGLGFLSGLAAMFGYGTILRFAETRWPWLHEMINNGAEKNKDPDEPK